MVKKASDDLMANARDWRVWDEVLQPACCRFELKVTGFHLALVFAASLSEVESGVKPFLICKTSGAFRPAKLICCIEDFKVFAGNWTLVLCERNQSLSRKIFYLELRLPAWILIIPNNGKRRAFFEGNQKAKRARWKTRGRGPGVLGPGVWKTRGLSGKHGV